MVVNGNSNHYMIVSCTIVSTIHYMIVLTSIFESDVSNNNLSYNGDTQQMLCVLYDTTLTTPTNVFHIVYSVIPFAASSSCTLFK
jgi:hypothetical protein